MNEASSQLSVDDSLYLGEPNVYLLNNDNVQLESVDTLVDPNDDQIDSSNKINLCSPSVEAIVTSDSTFYYECHEDQLVCKAIPTLGNACEVFKVP